MSVLTGIAPSDLLELDGLMFGAVLAAARRIHGNPEDASAPIGEAGKPERVSLLRLADIGGSGVKRVGVSKP